MKRALTAALACALTCAALALLYAVASAQSQEQSWCNFFHGPPGSVTINGQPAPPGTAIVVVSDDGEEWLSLHEVAANGSWRVWLPRAWEQAHLLVDGFRAPGGPFDIGDADNCEMRLDVGVETDPEPAAVYFHARSEDITLFGEPVPDGAQFRVFSNGEWYHGTTLTAGHDLGEFFPAGAEISFTIKGFPVTGGSIVTDPANAPFWITLHAGDPEHPPFRFYGPPGDIVDRRSLCWVDPLPPLEVIAYRDDDWERIVPVQPDGSWALEAPSGMTDFRFVVASIGSWLTPRPKEGPRYDASPSAGSQIVPLNYTHPIWYGFRGDVSAFRDEAAPETEVLVEVRRGRTIIEQIWVWPGDGYQISIPYGTLGVSLWVNGQLADRRLHNAVRGEPDPETGGGCVKRVDLKPQAAAAPTPPASLWTLEWLLLQRGAASRAGLE